MQGAAHMTTALPKVILRRRRSSARGAPDAMPRCDTGYCPNPTIWVPRRVIAVDYHYISPLRSGPSTLRPPSHQCLSRILQKQNPRTHPVRPEQANSSSTTLAPVSITLLLPAPALIYTGPRSGTLPLVLVPARQRTLTSSLPNSHPSTSTSTTLVHNQTKG